jgi:hypothetical protein
MKTRLVSFVPASAALLASSLALADVDAVPRTSIAEPRTTLYLSTGGGSVLDTPRGAVPSTQASLRLNLPLVRWAALELMATTGLSFGREEPDDFWARLGLGLRVEDATRAIRPYGSLRLVHIHFASAQTWIDYPLDSIAGSSTEGLQHRSGMALATGLSATMPGSAGRVRAMVEVELSWIPVGDPPAWFVATELGLGYVF